MSQRDPIAKAISLDFNLFWLFTTIGCVFSFMIETIHLFHPVWRMRPVRIFGLPIWGRSAHLWFRRTDVVIATQPFMAVELVADFQARRSVARSFHQLVHGTGAFGIRAWDITRGNGFLIGRRTSGNTCSSGASSAGLGQVDSHLRWPRLFAYRSSAPGN